MGRPRLTRQGTAAIELAVAGVAFLAVLARLWAAQRALWNNGLDPLDPFAQPRTTADVPAGTADALLVTTLGAVLTLLWLWLVVRAGRWRGRPLTAVAIGIPVVAALALYAAPPTLSIDAYSYLAHGHLALTPGRNPYVDAAASVGSDPYGALLGAAGWAPVHPQSPYGPLWTLLERTAVALSGKDVGLGVRLVKLPALLGLLAAAALTWDLVGRLRPQHRLRAVLLLLGNPLALIEFAGDGHNDGLMIGLVVLALWACARRRPALAIVALALAVLVKATPLVLVLPLLTHLLLNRVPGRRSLAATAGAVVGSAALAALLVAPYWAGAATFRGLAASGTPGPSWSPSGLLFVLLGGVDRDGSPVPGSNAGGTAQLALGAVLAAGSIAACFTSRSVVGLLRSCAAVALLALLLLPVEWPWYAALPAAILPLVPDGAAVAATAVLVLGSRLVAPYGDAAAVGLVGHDTFRNEQALVGQTLPALAALALAGARAVALRVDAVRRPRADGAAGRPVP